MDVNNKTLAVLLIAGMILSIAGTLSVLNNDNGGLTGYAGSTDTQYGTIDYNISSNVVLSFTTASVDFGTGYVDTTLGITNCDLTTEASGNEVGCAGFDDKTNSPLVLTNIGNKDAEVNLTFADAVTTFITQDGSGSSLQLKVTDTSGEGGACTGTQSLSSYVNANTFDSAAEITACGTFESDPSTNSIDIDVNLTIDMDESGDQSISLSAIATK